MNAVDYLIDTIKREIPLELLQFAFTPPRLVANAQVRPNTDFLIRSEVVYGWVLTDMNMVAGLEQLIDITAVPQQVVTGGIVMHIGKGPTGGRAIAVPLEVGFGYTATNSGGTSIASALSTPIQYTDARIQLIGPNTIFIEGYLGIRLTTLRCILENDKDMNNVNRRALFPLAEIATLAAKAYIYVKTNVRIASGEIVNGVSMAKYRELVDSYADANSVYREKMQNDWPKYNVFSDKTIANQYLRLITPK